MAQACFRFYEELNDFLPSSQRKLEFSHAFEGRRSVKDLIESLGVPHTEVELILVNGEPVGFERVVADGDRISVYPMFEALDVTPLVRLRERPLREPRFAVDVPLGTLARYLRLCGFDAWYSNDAGDETLAALAASQRRVLLTRDRELLKRRIVSHGCFVRSRRPSEQLAEVCRRLDLAGSMRPFTRCTRCNEALRPVEKAQLLHRLPDETRRCHDRFQECPACGRLYWLGSHARRLETIVASVRGASGGGAGSGAGLS